MERFMKLVRALHDWYFRLSTPVRWTWGIGGVLFLLMVLSGIGSGGSESSGNTAMYIGPDPYLNNPRYGYLPDMDFPSGVDGQVPYTERTAGGLIGSDGRTSYYNDPQSGVSVIPGEGVVY
jgi:hypothetical protein